MKTNPTRRRRPRAPEIVLRQALCVPQIAVHVCSVSSLVERQEPWKNGAQRSPSDSNSQRRFDGRCSHVAQFRGVRRKGQKAKPLETARCVCSERSSSQTLNPCFSAFMGGEVSMSLSHCSSRASFMDVGGFYTLVCFHNFWSWVTQLNRCRAHLGPGGDLVLSLGVLLCFLTWTAFRLTLDDKWWMTS